MDPEDKDAGSRDVAFAYTGMGLMLLGALIVTLLS
jgi:hypothetical protein